MEAIIPIIGKVKYQITLDPSVWIFDDRKVDLNTYFKDEKEDHKDELEEYTKSVSEHWDREIMEGAIFPPTLKSEKKFEKQKILEGSFAMPLKPFLLNAELHEEATIVVLQHAEGAIEVPLSEAFELLLHFSKEGKPLTENGPIHAYYKNGSNVNQPIKGITSIIVK